MKITKDEAIALLLNLFDDNKLTFRNMALLKSVFDEAVEACNDSRESMEAEYHMGQKPLPSLFSRDTEDDFYGAIETDVRKALSTNGATENEKTIEIITDLVVEKSGYTQEDLYFTP